MTPGMRRQGGPIRYRVRRSPEAAQSLGAAERCPGSGPYGLARHTANPRTMTGISTSHAAASITIDGPRSDIIGLAPHHQVRGITGSGTLRGRSSTPRNLSFVIHSRASASPAKPVAVLTIAPSWLRATP